MAAEAVRRWLSGLRFPRLAALALVVLAVDQVIPDALRFVDEIVLAAIATGLSVWRKRRSVGSVNRPLVNQG